jgi:rare lipoprotein A
VRPTQRMRDLRRAPVAAGALMIGIPAAAGALTATEAFGASALQANLHSSQVPFGHNVVVSGTAPSSDAGKKVELEFEPAGQRSWGQLTSSTIHGDGSYRLAAPVRRSGLIQVQEAGSTTTATAQDASAAAAPQRITVAAALRLRAGSLNALVGQPVHVRGKLLPGVAGRRVRLQARTGGGWRTVSTARTGPQGGFDLRYTGGTLGARQLRVRFAGDHLNRYAGAPAGRLTVYRQAMASWYDDGGTTGCGFHAGYGVANRTLPCGTKVSFLYGGRRVTATVDDRGPYVGGRDWDLNQNTAAAIGFGGVGTVWSSQ